MQNPNIYVEICNSQKEFAHRIKNPLSETCPIYRHTVDFAIILPTFKGLTVIIQVCKDMLTITIYVEIP
jgi:hypothetical protein